MHAGRPRSFDETDVLETIMQVFWEHGYENTTKRELMEATGVASQSLYNAFGDKKEMFRAALEHYAQTRHDQVRQMLEATSSPFDDLRGFVAMWANMPEEFERGCLLCNTSTQLDPTDDGELGEFLRGQLMVMRSTFLDSLTRARDAGELRKSADLEALASTLTAAANGVTIFMRMGAPDSIVEETVRGTIQRLESERTAPS